MKKILIVLLLASCTNKEYKYEIKGSVKTADGNHPAIWYTDTLTFDNDTAYYQNSDGTIVKIYPPYIIKDLEY